MSYYFPNTHNDDVKLINWRARIEKIDINWYQKQTWTTNNPSIGRSISNVEGILTLIPPGWSKEEHEANDIIIFHKYDNGREKRCTKVVPFKEYTDNRIEEIMSVGEGGYCYVWGEIVTSTAFEQSTYKHDHRISLTLVIPDLYNGEKSPYAPTLSVSNRQALTELVK
jgi:hypothetical protein